MSTTSEDRSVRIQALVWTVIALAIAVAGWVGLSRATQRGLDRLAAIDRVRAQCEQSWKAARTPAESLLVDRLALPDTIDPRSAEAIDRCGDLRVPSSAAARPNPREMNGQPMPRGLR